MNAHDVRCGGSTLGVERRHGVAAPLGARQVLRAMILLLVALVASLPAGDANTAGVACPVRAPALTGPMMLDAQGLTAGGKSVAWGDIAAAGFAGRVASHLDQGLITIAGEVVRGQPMSIDRTTVHLASGLFGQLRLPIAQVAVVILAPQALDGLATMVADKPGAVLANGDRVAGRVTFLDGAAVGIDTGRRVARVGRDRIAALLLTPPKAAAVTKTRPWLLLGSGDRLAVDAWKAEAAGIAVTGALGTAVIPAAAIAAVWAEGGRITPLGRLPATRLIAVDRLGGALPVAWGRGFPLTAGGVVAADGLLLPAFGSASWPVAGFGAFQCWVAPAPAMSGCTVRVLVDGVVGWERTLAAGAAAVPVTLQLAGAKVLALRCEPAPGGETADQAAVFAHAVVVK